MGEIRGWETRIKGKILLPGKWRLPGCSGFFKQLSKDLRSEFPDMQGFSERNLLYIKRFYLFYSQDRAIYHHLGEIQVAEKT